MRDRQRVSHLQRRLSRHARPRGFSLIELMVALAIAGVLLLGMSAYFVNSSRNFSETERVSRQIENGRYAASLLSEEVRHAGFYGEVGNVTTLPLAAVIPMPASLPNPCATDILAVSAALPIAIQGVDNVVAGTVPSCLPDYIAGTDVIAIRRANTTTVPAGAGGAAPVGGGYYTQTSFCKTDNPMFKVAQSGFSMTEKDCATVRPVRQYHVYIYYIAKCSIGTNADGSCKATDPAIPTLKRAELVAGGSFSVSPLVEGIENMQIEYGLDTTGDGNADSFTPAPATVGDWAKVAAVRFNLLARNTDQSPGYNDTKTYRLGLNADGSDNDFTPSGAETKFRRHVYTELVRVQNISQRIETKFP